MGTTLNDSIVEPIVDALAIEAARILDLECENIRNGYLYGMTQHLLILKGIYGFKFPKRFLEISSRNLTLLSILII